MLNCARGIHVLCLKSILVAYLGVRALCCLKVVVAGCWLLAMPFWPTSSRWVASRFFDRFLSLMGLA